MADNPPFTFMLPNGRSAGLYVDIWKEWSKVTGIKIEFVHSNFEVNMQQLKDGDADFHSGLFVNKNREKWAVFSEAIDKIDTKLFFNSDNLTFFKIKDLKGKRLGVGNESFQEYYIRENYPDINIIPYKNTERMINDLLENKLDAIISELPGLNSVMAKMGIISALREGETILLSNTVHALIPKYNQHLLPIINEGIKKFKTGTLIALEKKWLPGYPAFFEIYNEDNSFVLSRDEKDFLSKHRNLLLGIDNGWKPIEYVNDEGEFSGVTSEFVKIISNKLSIDLNPEVGNKWAVVLEKVKNGQLDILSGVVRSKEREQYLSFTKPYISFTNVIVTRKDAVPLLNINSLNGKKVATVEASINAERLIKHHPKVHLVPATTLDAGLVMLEAGEVFGFMGNVAVLANYINNNPSTNIHIALHTSYKNDLSFAVRKGLEPLIPILNRAISQISEQEKNEILNRWLSVQVKVGTELITILKWGVPGLVFLLSIIIYVVRSNAKMHTEIALRQKTENSLNEAKLSAEKALQKAESANQSKNQFLANMSHEIRTPMNAIIGTAHLLKEAIEDKEQLKLVDILDVSSKSLLSLINDILDLSKVEAGKIELEDVEFNLNELIGNVVKQASINLLSRNKKSSSEEVKLDFELASDVPNYVIGDRLRLSQIIINLLGNAVKFTEKGKIKIKVAVEQLKGKELTLHFVVEDTGIGMTQKQIDKLFKTYSQADSSISRKYGGTGLGLSISEKLCHLMQGDIWVRSEKDKGSQFHFTCVLKVSEFKQERLDKAFSQKKEMLEEVIAHEELYKNLKILIVDDNQINLTIASKILSNRGIQSESVMSGEDAIKYLINNQCDLVLMDVQMPGMDGYQATKAIRRVPKLANIPVIGLSANAMESDIKLGFDSGMNDYLSKPINPNLLFKAINSHLLKEK
ncbi:MAG: hypothetical protein COB38_03950 [Gammaproteobacteria bacterium]|nr:MAG: hypothetical protein COB38_03950 [Gammaproteobacteria bacterium]